MSEKISGIAEKAKVARARIAAALEGFQSKYRMEALLKYELARDEVTVMNLVYSHSNIPSLLMLR